MADQQAFMNNSGSGIATRIGGSLFAAAAVTFGLFFVMQQLVAFNDEVNLNEEKRLRFVDVLEDIEETKVQEVERVVEKPPEVEVPPQVDDIVVQIDGPSNLNIGIGPANADGGVELGGIDLGPTQDGDYLPLVRVQPQYPRRAQERGIEGYVVVELTVSEDGTVPPESIVIIEADPKGYFERAAMKAAEKFKYKPKVVNGKPQQVAGVQYRFTFDLAD